MRIPLILILFCTALSLHAQDDAEKKPEKVTKPWSGKTTLSGVQADGNSESTTISFAQDFEYKFSKKSKLMVSASGVRAESTIITPYAVGTEDDYTVEEVRTDVVSADQYGIVARYEQTFRPGFHWYGSGAWDRNEIAGIENRYAVSGGIGRQWADTDTNKLKSSWGLAHTTENRTFEPPNYNRTFGGYYATNNWWNKMTPTTTYAQDFAVGVNFEESGDVLASLKNNLTVAISTKLSLSVSADFTYDNKPAFISITDANGQGSFPLELKKLDSLYKTSLIISF